METATVQGVEVPKLGLGTWRLTGDECYDAVRTALGAGYRHVDTAQAYDNEREVGRAIADADVDAEEVFVTTKVFGRNARYDDAIHTARESRKRLGIDETLRAFRDLVDEGVTRHVGVSNFGLRQLSDARSRSEVPLLTDQVEFHPYHPQRKLLRYCQQNDVLLTAYSPLGHGGVTRDRRLREIGSRYDKTPAQVALRWATQHRNVVVIPKASSAAHITENAAAIEFRLDETELDAVARSSQVRRGLSWVRGRLEI
ncbi:aldehyde oxidoreductase [Halobacteriales archaeon SW_7_68_16]|nr:MAG: aldehyde oxidoreductase [Halobacteriales archaeon SW_7_68_16]